MKDLNHRQDVVSFDFVDRFVAATHEEDAALSKAIQALDQEGKILVGGIIGRFGRSGPKELAASERLAARRVLGKLRRVTNETLTLANRVLDYLDFDESGAIEPDELSVVVEILEIFSNAESPDSLLSERELRMLYAVLRHMDGDSSGRLEKREREALRRGLDDPRTFLAIQRDQNPHFREALGDV